MAKTPENFWAAFGDDSNFVEVECDSISRNLAYDVLNYYGLRCNSNIGGSLPNLDIAHMDAIQVVKMSLLEASAEDNEIYEIIMEPDGSVDFRAIGSYTGLSGGDIYYELQTSNYVERCGGVMVVGGKPLAFRRPVEWKPIWGEGEASTKTVYDTGLMYSNCIVKDFNQYATIVYNDLHMDTQLNDGVDNMYEITNENAWDEIMGWAHFLDWPGWETDKDTIITQSNTAKILLPLGTLGSPKICAEGSYLTPRPAFDETDSNPACFEGMGETVAYEDGVELEIPSEFRFESVRGTQVDKFISVAGVYVIGYRIDDLRGRPASYVNAVKQTPEPADSNIWVYISSTIPELIQLDLGKHFAIAYDDEQTFKTPYIVFADNSRILDPTQFGNDITYYVDPFCPYWEAYQNDTEIGTILPTSDVGGILVKELWVAVELETPSIVVYNPDGFNRKANEVAKELDFQVAPLVVVEEPPPMAFNGQLMDQARALFDHDPTTVQDMSDTDYEEALDTMDGGGMTLRCSFLDEDGVVKLSDALYDYMNSGDGIEATYVCGPGTDVELGGTAPNGGIVNSITYSYQDQNSYTISVNAGAKLTGDFASVEGGPTPKQASNDSSMKGTIIQDMGNHIFFKVRIDGFGERIAVNMCPQILRVGDKVQCTVNNNPMEA
jgi:hypothetical protein